MTKRTDALTEAVLKTIEGLRVQYGEPGRPMKQKTLARRSGQTYARVHKFLSGQMPYPPLDFLNALLQSFGVSLADALKGQTTPPKQLPIQRADVQRVAALLDDAPVELVEETERMVRLFLRAGALGESSDRSAEAPKPAKALAVSGKPNRRDVRPK
jgi:transcriptional regulator with XRE-family HTH domain